MAQASVLIVEDDPILAEAYGAVLARSEIGYKVVHDGEEALRFAKSLRPDKYGDNSPDEKLVISILKSCHPTMTGPLSCSGRRQKKYFRLHLQ